MEPWSPLPVSFFAQCVLTVARDLVGKHLVMYRDEGIPLVARIVETEAYRGDDPACHAYSNCDAKGHLKDFSRRSAGLFASPGLGYVYLNYGMYWLLNVVAESKGSAAGVLIRALQPIQGMEWMRERRPKIKKEFDLTNGPGKLTLAFGIDDRFHLQDLTQPPLYFAEGPKEKVVSTTRIGIQKGVELPWRFLLPDNPWVSRGKPS